MLEWKPESDTCTAFILWAGGMPVGKIWQAIEGWKGTFFFQSHDSPATFSAAFYSSRIEIQTEIERRFWKVIKRCGLEFKKPKKSTRPHKGLPKKIQSDHARLDVMRGRFRIKKHFENGNSPIPVVIYGKINADRWTEDDISVEFDVAVERVEYDER